MSTIARALLTPSTGIPPRVPCTVQIPQLLRSILATYLMLGGQSCANECDASTGGAQLSTNVCGRISNRRPNSVVPVILT